MWSTSFLWDPLSQIFCLITSLVGVFVVGTAFVTIDPGPKRRKLVLGLIVFWFAMLGLVTADHAVNLFFFWELTSFTSFFLIGFYSDQEKSRKNALQALVVTSVGGIALLIALLAMGVSTGSLYFSEWDPAQKVSILVTALIFLAAMTKSAIFPFHFWLPNAMVAPAPVSAFLHSAAMVKAGFFILLRLGPWLEWESSLAWTLQALAFLGAVWAAILAYCEVEVKRALAYTTLSQLGFLVAWVVWEQGVFSTTLQFFFIGHALYKACLFLSGGLADRVAGVKSFDLSSSRVDVSKTAAVGIWLCVLSGLGVPPLMGFFAKEKLLESALETQGMLILILFSIALIFQGTVLVRLLRLFKARGRATKEGLFLLGLGVSSLMVPFFFDGSLGFLLAAPTHLVFWISVSLLIGAVVLARFFVSMRERRGFSRIFFDGWEGIKSFAVRLTGLLHSKFVRNDLLWILIPLSIGLLWWRGRVIDHSVVTQKDLLMALVLCGGLLLTLLAKTAVPALLGLGVVGFGVALVFAAFGAPDLALTQILIETLGLVLMVLILRKFPPLENRSSRGKIVRDALIAGSFGLGISFLLWEVLEGGRSESLKEFFLREALSTGRGSNVVNVILVDIRALDTLGEITVLAIASLACLSVWMTSRREDS